LIRHPPKIQLAPSATPLTAIWLLSGHELFPHSDAILEVLKDKRKEHHQPK
jgi:hypothetical protein